MTTWGQVTVVGSKRKKARQKVTERVNTLTGFHEYLTGGGRKRLRLEMEHVCTAQKGGGRE